MNSFTKIVQKKLYAKSISRNITHSDLSKNYQDIGAINLLHFKQNSKFFYWWEYSKSHAGILLNFLSLFFFIFCCVKFTWDNKLIVKKFISVKWNKQPDSRFFTAFPLLYLFLPQIILCSNVVNFLFLQRRAGWSFGSRVKKLCIVSIHFDNQSLYILLPYSKER